MCVSTEFVNLPLDERELVLCKKLTISVGELRQATHNSLISMHLLTPSEEESEFPAGSYGSRGYHWLSAFTDEQLEISRNTTASAMPFKVIHFYGYKGGQARSTLLALVARDLAEDGWRVLAIDADLEAPSLDVIFSRTARSLSSTLLGLIQDMREISPERILPATGSGYVDLLPFRPQSADYDIDAVAVTLRATMDPADIEKAATGISNLATARQYDVILVDHRSGLAHTTLPWMAALPGPTVICVRLDEQWRPAQHSIKAVLRMNSSDPGLFVSWKPDEELLDTYRQRNYTQATSLLDSLAEVIASGGEAGDSDIGQLDLGFAELEDHWVIWPYDPAFRQVRMPDKAALSGQSIETIGRIRSLLEISEKQQTTEAITSVPLSLSPSGSIDPGDLIQTDAIRQLKTPRNSISFILGRKGTGKTRLLRELAEAKLGEPLVVDPNTNLNMGIKSASPEFVRAASFFNKEPIDLWWRLLSAALENATTSSESFTASFASEIGPTEETDPVLRVLDKCRRWPKRTFLLDGLETSFTSDKIFQFVESLFRFLQIIDSDARLNERIQIKLFLRTDLAQRGFQNIEQQLHGRTIYLSWDTQKIFNFVLSRIQRSGWFQRNFPELVARIHNSYQDILNGNLSVTECENLLMHAFPAKLSRNNLATKTFLKTYFADTASDRPQASTSDKLRYYPRIFDKFLEVIADPKKTDQASFQGQQLDRDGKISQGLIFFAHEAAAADYLEQLRSELNYLINFSDDPNENAEKVRNLLAAFDGLRTPFTIDDHVLTLATRTSIPANEVLSAMRSMRSMGLFEDRPGYASEWRVGRLFKSALRMKYVRA
jgi:Mrp family chromosome partitioning ATPase